MAYVVGLMATDGCVLTRRGHLSFDTCDEQLVRTYLACLGRALRYRTLRTQTGGVRYKAQFGDIAFYLWLIGVGIHPRKSLTLGAIDVPDEHLLPLVRGLLDGDGTISNFMSRATKKTYPDYVYERFLAQFTSASRPHLEWLRACLAAALGVRGWIHRFPPRPPSKEFFRLNYGRADAIVLLKALYSDPDAPCLLRKREIWDSFRERHGIRELAATYGSSSAA